jgi:hypothetical protein
MTETIDHSTLAEALVAFQGEVGAVAKDSKNDFFKSKYADLAAVKAEAQPLLTKHGLGVIQEPGYLVVGDKVHDTLTTTVIFKQGGVQDGNGVKSSTMILRPVKSDPQGQGSAITYARRYAFMAVLGLVADDDDDDGNAASAPPKKPTKTAEQVAVEKAQARVKAAAKAADVPPAVVTAYFTDTYVEDSLIKSTNIKALNETAEHFEGVANAKNELGGTEV